MQQYRAKTEKFEMLIQDATFTFPQTRRRESDAESSVQITDVCRTLSGHIGGTGDEYRFPPMPKHYHK